MIAQLDSDTFTSLESLTILNVQYNFLKYFHTKSSFKLIKIVLAGNHGSAPVTSLTYRYC